MFLKFVAEPVRFLNSGAGHLDGLCASAMTSLKIIFQGFCKALDFGGLLEA